MYEGVSLLHQSFIGKMLQQFAKFSLVEMLLILLSGATIKMEASLLNRLTRWQGRFKGKIGQNH